VPTRRTAMIADWTTWLRDVSEGRAGRLRPGFMLHAPNRSVPRRTVRVPYGFRLPAGGR